MTLRHRNKALDAIAKHTYKNHIILGENLVQTNHFTPTIVHDKPIAIGVSILELVSYNFTIFRNIFICWNLFKLKLYRNFSNVSTNKNVPIEITN